jgi:hypothetical protein
VKRPEPPTDSRETRQAAVKKMLWILADPHWDHMVELLKVDRNAAVKELENATTWESVLARQAQIRYIDRLLALDAEVTRLHRTTEAPE